MTSTQIFFVLIFLSRSRPRFARPVFLKPASLQQQHNTSLKTASIQSDPEITEDDPTEEDLDFLGYASAPDEEEEDDSSTDEDEIPDTTAASLTRTAGYD